MDNIVFNPNDTSMVNLSADKSAALNSSLERLNNTSILETTSTPKLIQERILANDIYGHGQNSVKRAKLAPQRLPLYRNNSKFSGPTNSDLQSYFSTKNKYEGPYAESIQKNKKPRVAIQPTNFKLPNVIENNSKNSVLKSETDQENEESKYNLKAIQPDISKKDEQILIFICSKNRNLIKY